MGQLILCQVGFSESTIVVICTLCRAALVSTNSVSQGVQVVRFFGHKFLEVVIRNIFRAYEISNGTTMLANNAGGICSNRWLSREERCGTNAIYEDVYFRRRSRTNIKVYLSSSPYIDVIP